MNAAVWRRRSRMRRRCGELLRVLACAALGVAPAGAQGSREIGWVGLYTPELIDTLEAGSAPRTKEVVLFAAPAYSAHAVGRLRLVATPRRGLEAFFIGEAGGPPRAFTPDLVDPDWGYGPYFHQTFLERRGSWFLLPEDPFPRGTWINAADLATEPDVRLVREGTIITSPRGDLFVLATDGGTLSGRPEQAADMPCGEEPAPVAPFTPVRLSRGDLYDGRGHLRVQLKYLRGC